MFLQRLKALSDGENEATFLHLNPMGDSLYAYCSEVQRPLTFVFTP